MATQNLTRCPNCEWRGRPTELDDSTGGPECPECGSRVMLR